MRVIASTLASAAVLLAGGARPPLAGLAASYGGQAQAQNSRSVDPAAVQAGAALFRQRCADCHGPDAKGARGPDLTRLWTTDASDARVFQTIRKGIPGSIMPPSLDSDDEVWAIVAYLRSLGTSGLEASGPAGGNAEAGERIFAAQCATCHQINGRGGRLGPDLSRIAATQTNQLLARAIREASVSFTSTYEPVTLITRDGQQIRGTRKAEDAFSIQIMDTRERLQGYLKANLREVTRDKKSLMPDFGPDRLSDQDLNDLVAYLAKFRISAPPKPAPAADRTADQR